MLQRSDGREDRQTHRDEEHRKRAQNARGGRRILGLALGGGNQGPLGPAEGVARGRECRRVVLLVERLGVGGFHEDEVEGLLEDLEGVEADGGDDHGEVLVDLVGGEGGGGRVAGDVDVVDLGDGGVEAGDVEGHADLDGDGERADGGDEDDRGAEGELDAEVQVFGGR